MIKAIIFDFGNVYLNGKIIKNLKSIGVNI